MPNQGPNQYGGVDIDLTTHIVQQLYKAFQLGPIKVLDVCFQVFVTEKFVKEGSVDVVRGVEFLQPCLDIRNRWGVRADRDSGSLGRDLWRRCVLERRGMNVGGEGRRHVSAPQGRRGVRGPSERVRRLYVFSVNDSPN